MITLTDTFSGHAGPVLCLALSPDGGTLASGSRDRTVRLWETGTGACRAVLQGHRGPVAAVAFSPDGRTLASAGGDAGVRLWEADSGAEIAALDDPQGAVEALAWLPDGSALAAGWNMWSFGHITLWDGSTWESMHTVRADHGQLVFDIALTAEGALIAALAAGYLRVWDAAGHAVRTVRAHGEAVRCLALSPDGRRLATGSSDRAIRLWDVQTWGSTAALKGHTDAVYGLAWSPDGARLASAGGDGLRLWEAASGRAIGSTDEGGPLRAVRFGGSGGAVYAAGARLVRFAVEG